MSCPRQERKYKGPRIKGGVRGFEKSASLGMKKDKEEELAMEEEEERTGNEGPRLMEIVGSRDGESRPRTG